MSKYIPTKKPLFPDKNVFTTTIIPSNNKDEIISLAKAGEFGKLEQLLLNMPVKTIFEDTILHTIIKSDMTPIQKETIIKLLLKKGVYINKLDDTGLPPIYYAINQQLYDVTKLLIDKKANLNIKLPNGFDLFQTALIPSIKECPAQLINIKDQADIGKIESQMLNTELEFRKIILGLQPTRDMIKDILEFLDKYPNFSIKYINFKNPILNPNPPNQIQYKVDDIWDTNILDQETKDYFPIFKNDVHFKLKSLGTDLTKFVTSYNESQINEFINTGISNIKTEFNSTLKTNLLSTNYPKVNDVRIAKVAGGNYDYNTIYTNLFDFEKYSINKIEEQLKGDLDAFINELKEKFNTFKTNINDKIQEINNKLIDVGGNWKYRYQLPIIVGVAPVNIYLTFNDRYNLLDANYIIPVNDSINTFRGGAEGQIIIGNILGLIYAL